MNAARLASEVIRFVSPMKIFFALASLGIGLGGCSRDVVDKAKLQMNLPKRLGKIGTAATDLPVMMVIVNVRGPGIPGVLIHTWESPCTKMRDNNVACDPAMYAPYIEMEVPKGDGRLIQVLAIASAISSGGGKGPMKFYYGDEGRSLLADYENSSIEVLPMGTSLEEANFNGRILEAGANVRTGKIIHLFKPAGGKPNMELSRSEIFGGWVSHLFLLQGASFDIAAEGVATPILSGLTLDGIGTAGHPLNPSSSLMQVRLPQTYQWWSGNSSPVREQSPEFRFYGYLGAGVSSTNKVCYSSTSAQVNGLYTMPDHVTPVYWDPASTDVTKIRVTGGGIAPKSSCSDVNASFSIDETKMGNGSDGPYGIRGPFALVPSNNGSSGFAVVDTTLNPDRLKWSYAPGVFAGLNPISGITVFYGTPISMNGDEPYRFHGMEDGIDCQGLSRGFYPGYQQLGDFLGSSVTQVDLPITMEGLANNYKFVLCPFRDDGLMPGHNYFSSGVESYSQSGGSGGGGVGGSGLSITGPASISTSSCSSFTVSRPDMMGTLMVNLTDGGGGGQFFANFTDCNSQVSSTSTFYIPSAVYSSNFYYRRNASGAGSLNANASGYSPAFLAISIGGGGGGGSNLTITGNTSIPSGVCSPFTANTPSPVSQPTQLVLAGQGSGMYYVDPGCGAPVAGPLMLSPGMSTMPFYYKNYSVEYVGMLLTAISGDMFPSGNYYVNVGGGGGSALSITGPGSIPTNSCTSYSINRPDMMGVANVSLSDSGGGQFYFTNTDCVSSISPLAVIPINPGFYSVTVYFKKMSVGASGLNAIAAGYGSGYLAIAVGGGGPSLMITGNPSLAIGDCSTYVVSTPNPVSVPTSISLGGAGSGTFYTDGGCGAPLSGNLMIGSGTSTTNFYYRNYTVQSISLMANTAGGDSFAPANFAINVGGGGGATLSLTGPPSISTSSCVAYTINRPDMGASVSVSMNDSGAGGQFFMNNTDCTAGTPTVGAVMIPGASYNTMFFYKKNSAGVANLNINAGGYSPGFLSVSVGGGGGSTLSITGNPNIAVSYCEMYTVNRPDSGTNVTVALADGGMGGLFYLYPGDCSASINSTAAIPLNIGMFSTTFYYKKPSPASVTLSVNAGGYTPGSLGVNVGGGGGGLVITGPASIPTATCTSYSINRPDMTGTYPITLNDGGMGGQFFANSSDCSASVNQTGVVTLTTGLSNTLFYYKRPSPGAVNLQATSGMYPTGNFAINVGGGGAALGLTGNPNIAVSVCEMYTINRPDSGTNVTVALADSGMGGMFYMYMGDCTSSINSTAAIPLNIGMFNTTFYYKKPSPATVNLTANAGGYSQGNLSVNVGGGGASMSITGPPTLVVNTCGSYTVLRSDTIGTVAATLNDGGAGGQFFISNSNCVGNVAPVGSVSINSGLTSTVFYYKRPSVGAVNLSAGAGGYSPGNFGLSVTP